jgi:AraC-like DNA-binding protein
MQYREFTPHAALRPYIRSYFHLRATGKRFQQPADGCPSLMISMGDPFALGFEDGKLEAVSGCRVLGPSSRRLFTIHAGCTNLVTVKFVPGQLSRFFQVPAFELTDTSTDLESLWGKSGRQVEERLVNQIPGLEIAKSLDDVFLSRVSSHSCPHDTIIPMAVDLMYRLSGRIAVGEVAERMGLSQRQFERHCADSVGLPPKRICRIARFLNTFSRVATHERLDWSKLAYSNEYSDQAHLIRECKFFTSYSPVAYLKNRSSRECAVMCTVAAIPT